MQQTRSTDDSRRRRSLVAMVFAIALLVTPLSVSANEYEESEAGHPVRIVAYILHPVGVILDYMIFRPAHKVVSWGPLRELFGHHEAY